MKANALPWVIPAYCEGCTACVGRCPKQCLQMVPSADEGVFIPWLTEVDACVGCGKCAEACAMGGIAMTAYVERAAMRFKSPPRPFGASR